MTDPEILERHLLAQDMASRAAALAMVYWRSRDTLATESKSSLQDIVSEADRAVERQMRAEVAMNFPDDGFIGEEFGQTEGKSGFTWVVDPVDGTSPYLHGIPNWCVAVAVVKGADTVSGVISVPTHSEQFSAMKGAGAQLNGAVLEIPTGVTIRNATTAVGFSQHSEPETVARLVRDLQAEGGVVFNNGSGALMLAYVAAGRVAGCVAQYMNSWDCIAGLLIVREAGGVTADFAPGSDLMTPDRVLAAAPGAWEDLSRLAEAAKG